jgi:hypothetical protein
MAPSRRTLWITLGVIALLCFALDFLETRAHAGAAPGTVLLIAGIVGLGNNRIIRDQWRPLRSGDQWLLILAWYALFVAAVIFDTRKMPSPADFDITFCATVPIVGTALYFLYRAFSKSMDALWLRITRR